MLLDKALLAKMELLFQDTQARVITAVKVNSRQGGLQWTTGKSKRPPPGKARILCITAKRSKSSHGYRCTLHVVKQNDASGGTSEKFQIRKSMGLKFLSRMEAVWGDTYEEDIDVEAVFALTFTSSIGTGLSENRVMYGLPSKDDRSLLLACLYQLSTEHDRCTPAVLGVDVGELSALSRTDKALALLGEFGAELLTLDDPALSVGRMQHMEDGSGSVGTSISSKEERDLQGLMQSFKVGIGNVDEFMDRLDETLKALEAANVHSILEGNMLVEGVLKRLDGTLHMLEDMEAQMSVYNFRLQHLRDDISAIELRNNRLEVAAQNSAALLEILQNILGHLTLPGDTVNELLNVDFDRLSERQLVKVVDNAWQLERTLRELEPGEEGGLSEGLLRMLAVRERKAHLKSNAHQFVRRAGSFLVDRFHSIDESFNPAEIQTAFRHGVLENSEIHASMRAFVPLVEVIKALDPASLAQLRSEYVRALNSLVRKQMRACTSMLKAAVRMANAQAPPEADMSTRRVTRRSSSFSIMSGRSLNLRRRGSTMSAHAGSLNSVASPSASNANPLSNSPSKTIPSLSTLPSMMLGSLHDIEPRSLNDAYSSLLDVFIPLLLKEADFAVDLLLLGRVVEDGQNGRPPRPSRRGESRLARVELEAGTEKVLALLLDGVQGELLMLVDLAGKSGQQQQLCIPMLRATLPHQAEVAAVTHLPGLHVALTECEKQLRANFEAYVSECEGSIRRFEPRRTMRGGGKGKHVHVAPFVENFKPFVARLEELIRGFQGSEDAGTEDRYRGEAETSEADSHRQSSGVISSLFC